MKSVATLFTASLLATSAAAFSGSSSFSGSQLAQAPASSAVLTMEYIPSWVRLQCTCHNNHFPFRRLETNLILHFCRFLLLFAEECPRNNGRRWRSKSKTRPRERILERLESPVSSRELLLNGKRLEERIFSQLTQRRSRVKLKSHTCKLVSRRIGKYDVVFGKGIRTHIHVS